MQTVPVKEGKSRVWKRYTLQAGAFGASSIFLTRCPVYGRAGRANGTTNTLDGPYDGYAECVKVVFDEKCTSVTELMEHLFEIIDPYSLNKQGVDVGKKYRTGLYSTNPGHLEEARAFIDSRKDRDKIVVEVLPLTNYVRSAEEHQHHLERYPEDCSYCHIPDEVLNKYRNQ